jgi:hypothetical protein
VITPRAVFQHKTVAALAGAAVVAAVPAAAALDDATGALPATPIMHWLAGLGGPIDRSSQAMLLQMPGGVREADLVAALQAVIDHHDALRLRVVWWPAGGSAEAPELEILPRGSVAAVGCLRRRISAGSARLSGGR